MKLRSIEARLATLFSLLLLAGLISLGAALWIGFQYNMVSAVDDLLEARTASLVRFVNTEFGNVFVESVEDKNLGEFRGRVEAVEPGRHAITMNGVRIELSENTEFEGSLRPSGLQAGQFAEVEVARAGPNESWRARTVGVVDNLQSELRESLREYAMGAPEGRYVQIWTAAGEKVLRSPPAAEWPVPAAWRNASGGFSTVRTPSGPFRALDRELSFLGGNYWIRVCSSLAVLEATRKSLLYWLWWAIPSALALSLCGGYLISRAALRPLDTFAAVAARIGADRLSERLEPPGTRDVVERLALTFNAMLARLESSVKRLEQFTADASHELRGAVAVIRTTAELAVRQHRAEGELRADMAEIQGEAERLTGLIEDLLILARADGGNDTPLPMERVDLGAIAVDVAERFRRQMGAPSRIHVDIDEQALLIYGHAPSLERLLAILVDNAVRHTPPDSSIRIAAGEEGGQRVLSVSDTGQGVSASALPHLFDRFYRADPSRDRSAGGHGLGLSIAKCIAELHGGRIDVFSVFGQGTTFWIWFPTCAEAAARSCPDLTV